MTIRHAIEQLRKQHVKSPPLTIGQVRENVLFGIILTISIAGMIAYVPSIVGSIYGGFYDTAAVDTLFYFWAVFLLLCKKISFTQRALGVIIPVGILSLYLIVRFGIYGAGFLWLFVVPILAGVLLGLQKGFITLLATLAALLLIGFTIEYFHMFADVFGAHPLLTWSIMSGNAMALGALVMVSSSVMVMGLNKVLWQLNHKMKELALTKDATIETVATLAEYRDTDTGEHIERTKKYVRIIAEHLSQNSRYGEKLTPEYILLLSKSAALHDIGKIGVPDNILLKPGKLTSEEFEVMKQHTVYGRDALLKSEQKLGHNSFLRLAAEIAYTHQERWDGTGYPLGLAGEAIPLSGRIMAVADVYDALTSDRPYKSAMGHDEAMAYLKENGGILFDPEIIAFIPSFEEEFRRVHDVKHP